MTGGATITPSVVPTSLPAAPVDVDRFRTPDGKIRCYNTLLYSGAPEGDEYGLWCFADSNGPGGEDCTTSPGPAVIHMPIDGQPIYAECSAQSVTENMSRQGKMVTVPAGTVVSIGYTTCHVEASGVSVLCAGNLGAGFSMSSTENSVPEFDTNCDITEATVHCTEPSGQTVS